MNKQQQLIGQPLVRPRYLFSWVSSAGMFLVIGVASCTSSEVFSEIYTMVTEFLSISRSSLSASLRGSPNFGHFVCYAVLSLSLAGVFSHRRCLLAPLLAGTFGVAMELVQMFIPSRDASLMDIGVNVLGVAVGFGVYLVWVVYKRKKKLPEEF